MPKGSQGWLVLKTRADRVLCQQCAFSSVAVGGAGGLFFHWHGGSAAGLGSFLGLLACLPMFYLLRYLRDPRNA
jgi:hypothetical protein